MKLRKIDQFDANGIKSKSVKFYAIFVDHARRLRRLPLLADRGASSELARTVDRLNSLKAANNGDVLPPELARAVEAMPETIRATLAKWAIISAAKSAATKPLAEHLDDWRAALSARDNTGQHVAATISRVGKIINGCRFVTVSDVSASAVQKYLADLRKDRTVVKTITKGGVTSEVSRVKRGISATSFNYYLRDARSFFTWMIGDCRCHTNPLAALENVNTRTDRRHDRRALSPDELRWMIDTASTATGERYGMTGPARAALYRLAAETGLRAGEIRSLTRASFQLDDQPVVTIAASYAKNRRQDSIPLRGVTVAAMADHLAGKLPAAPAFNLPKKDRIVEMFRADLADARQAWLESHQTDAERSKAAETTFLSPVDDAGRFADFHALRHSFITNLVTGGVHPKTAQRLARHSTIGLTMDRYTHMHKADMADALESLPDLSAPQRQSVRATGTYDTPKTAEKSLSLPESLNHGIRWNDAHRGALNSGGLEHQGNIGNTGQIGGISEGKSTTGPLGGIGRRDGFKIHFPKGVSVQVR